MAIRAENREKVKKIVVVACAIFAVLMVIALVISLVSFAKASARKNRLEAQLNELNEQIERNVSDIDYYRSSEYIEMVAREYLDMRGDGEISFVGK